MSCSVPLTGEAKALADLVEFARVEVEAADIEPWAELLRAVFEAGCVDLEEALWLIKLYNAYDGAGSAFGMFSRWRSPMAWTLDPARNDAEQFPCTQERRGLRGGKVIRHLDSYVACLDGATQDQWLTRPLQSGSPHGDFVMFLANVRRVWGCGRQSAFEWAEFAEKVVGYKIEAPDAQLWESEGPRRALQRLYGNPKPTLAWLNERANECRAHLAAEGVELSWEDFETVICDFNVMRDGRYYPGRHLAALKEEILEVEGGWRGLLLDLFMDIIPAGWREIPPGIDKSLMPVYRDSGLMVRLHGWQ